MTKDKVRLVARGGLFIALQIVLGSLLSIQFLTLKISFAFIVTAISARFFRPFEVALISAVGYFLGMILFPKFPFFPGFILTAFLTGLVFGYAYSGQITVKKLLLTNFFVTFGLNLFLNSLWLNMLYGTSWDVLMSTRFIQQLIQFPVYCVTLFILFRLPIISQLRKEELN
ncbi:folate family ECF transporter S component [Candidatus Enterococcus mansonii]|uniref:Integral membrane protein n=1 Tax=Candidatus Enterococcus mansonii TaxID=1834181 RepID=A0A242C7C7_9ENTE|nr:folate family ECF transporter S component [Enterococcus sp. 4G2_DIV0659]OTO05810.1 hypothetical protein A5880_002985 [Enterococcus sp. 4G2_DIV0659]